MKTENEKGIIIYALIAVAILMIVGFFPAKSHAQTIDMSFGQVLDSGKRNIYRMKIQVSEDITYKWLTVTPYGGWETWSQWKSKNPLEGNPFIDTYSIGIKVNIYENWYIDFNHYCTHNIIDSHDGNYMIVENKYWQGKKWNSSLETITVGYHKKFSSWDLN